MNKPSDAVEKENKKLYEGVKARIPPINKVNGKKWNRVEDLECGICLNSLEAEGVFLYGFSSMKEAKELQMILEKSNAKVGLA